jgi:hypothetical protein
VTSFRLYGCPRPLPTESPTSWVQRVCQQYDLTYPRFLACIGKRAAKDIDLALNPEDYLALSTICGIELGAFDWMRHSLGRCAWMRELRALLGFREKLLPSYRFCSLCWREDSIPFLRLEWRFARWTICPAHKSTMSECCPTCREPLQIHRSVMGGGGRVVGSLASCYCCGSDMRFCLPPPLLPDAAGSLARTINTQRSIVSAVLHGYFFIDCFGERALPVKRLPSWVRHGVLEGSSDEERVAVRPIKLEERRSESGRLSSRIDSMLDRRTSARMYYEERAGNFERPRAAGWIGKPTGLFG